jgi:hypothetical protein
VAAILKEIMNKEVFTVDNSGTKFENGVTNFTAEALYDCLCEIGNPKENVTLHLHGKVFDRLSYYNLMTPDCVYDVVNGTPFQFQGVPITKITRADNGGSIFHSEVYVDGKLRAILKTRVF